MRCSNIEFFAKIPVPTVQNGDVSRPKYRDLNGNAYSISAIRAACEEAQYLPITIYNERGESVTVGVTDSIEWSPAGYIAITGILKFGGTSEQVVLGTDKCANSMHIESLSFGVE